MSRPPIPADHLHAVAFPAVTVLIDLRAGGVEALLGPASAWLAALSTGADADTAAAVSGLPRNEATALIAALTGKGYLAAAQRSRADMITGIDPGPSWGTREQPVALAAVPRPSVRPALCAAVGVALVLLTARCGRRQSAFARQAVILRLLATLHLRPASREQIADTVSAVRWIGSRIPARVACLEEATASVLALALHGQSAIWCHGVAPDPIRLHAWVADQGGEPVAEPTDTAVYTVVSRVPDQ